jgi:hypothetical protein
MARRGKVANRDLALVFGQSEDGEEVHVLRRRAGSGAVEAGTLRPLKEGRAITGEVVHLQPRKEAPFLYDCETDEELSAATPASDRPNHGPAQVATEQYRKGWDAIWGSHGRSASVN